MAYESELEKLFQGSVATGIDVYIPSGMSPPEESFDQLGDISGFSRLMGNSVGSTTLGGGCLGSKNTETNCSSPTRGRKKQKLIAVTRLKKSIERVAAAYERKNELLHSMKVEVDKYSLAVCVELLNETDIIDGSEEWDFAYGQLASQSIRQLFIGLPDANRRAKWLLREFSKMQSLFKMNS